MSNQVFLGGACGSTSWRKDTAIPILEAAGITYFNPQLAVGEWTPAHQYTEMEAKEAAEVWLFVINESTRGIASIGEVAYRIGLNRKLALCLVYLPYGAVFEDRALTDAEIDDINRGRVFLSAMAEQHGIPVFDNVELAAHHAVALAQQATGEITQPLLNAILQKVETNGHGFIAGRIADGFWVQVSKSVKNAETGDTELMTGRRWLIEPHATEDEVVRTLIKAVLTWEEHEAREHFRYDGMQLFNPHFKLPV